MLLILIFFILCIAVAAVNISTIILLQHFYWPDHGQEVDLIGEIDTLGPFNSEAHIFMGMFIFIIFFFEQQFLQIFVSRWCDFDRSEKKRFMYIWVVMRFQSSLAFCLAESKTLRGLVIFQFTIPFFFIIIEREKKNIANIFSQSLTTFIFTLSCPGSYICRVKVPEKKIATEKKILILKKFLWCIKRIWKKFYWKIVDGFWTHFRPDSEFVFSLVTSFRQCFFKGKS